MKTFDVKFDNPLDEEDKNTILTELIIVSPINIAVVVSKFKFLGGVLRAVWRSISGFITPLALCSHQDTSFTSIQM